ncbi:MAG TPA: secretin N-terminal domain-containing protein [Candidatus Omnitrophota bacterium]|nr:secretin N-terminal domain-containing protein [Candidatus Omnitrophota bacterium]
MIVDEPSATVILVDIPEALDLMEKTTRNLDMPKETEVFSLKYAKAEELKEQLSGVMTSGSSTIELDSRTNKIAITDLPDKMKRIKKLVTEFDEATKQVLVEAQIVQISLSDETQYGINWEKLFKLSAFGKFSPDFMAVYPTATLSNYNKLSVGTMDANNFTVVIQALNTFTKTNILSRPRIAVTNNQEANILIGSKEVYFSQTQSQSSVTTTTAESVNYVDVGVKLNVTPTITDDGFVVMKIRPEVSTVREFATSPLGSRVPVVETSQAETTVKVKDGAMIMIAGLMKEQVSEDRKRMPFFGKLPFLRWLFGNFDNTKTKTELAIFLTPRIITGDLERLDVEKEQVKSKGIVTKKIKGRLESQEPSVR